MANDAFAEAFIDAIGDVRATIEDVGKDLGPGNQKANTSGSSWQ